jgi:hypothetical protein
LAVTFRCAHAAGRVTIRRSRSAAPVTICSTRRRWLV